MNYKERKYQKMSMKYRHDRKIYSLKSRIDWLERELDYKQSIIDGTKRRENRDFETIMMQREKIVSLCLALEDVTGIEQNEELLKKYYEKEKYVSCFLEWIDSEPPVWKLFAWVKWKKNKPERMCYND